MPGPEPTPRRARSDDAEAAASVWWRSRRAAAPPIPLPVHGEREVHAWLDGIISSDWETWVGEADGAVVAILVLRPGWIEQLYVDPDFTGRRLGSRLMAVAKAAAPTGLDLWTFQANTGARRFYERHGFMAVATTDGDNEEGAPDIRYRWPGP